MPYTNIINIPNSIITNIIFYTLIEYQYQY